MAPQPVIARIVDEHSPLGTGDREQELTGLLVAEDGDGRQLLACLVDEIDGDDPEGQLRADRLREDLRDGLHVATGDGDPGQTQHALQMAGHRIVGADRLTDDGAVKLRAGARDDSVAPGPLRLEQGGIGAGETCGVCLRAGGDSDRDGEASRSPVDAGARRRRPPSGRARPRPSRHEGRHR